MIKHKIVLVTIFSISIVIAFAQNKKPSIKKPIKTEVPSATVLTEGKAIYMQYCVSCHQLDGGGVQNMNPPLIKTSYVLGDKQKLVSILLKGMSHQEIDGESYHNVMPPFDYLPDKEIADVLTYIRNSFGNKAGIVTAAEVKVIRDKIK